jgi:hypothetical protein
MSGFKMKGSPMQRNFGVGASPVKHGDGSWGGTDKAPIVEDALTKNVVDGKRVIKYKPLNRENYPFNTDEEFAELEAKNKARFEKQ